MTTIARLCRQAHFSQQIEKTLEMHRISDLLTLLLLLGDLVLQIHACCINEDCPLNAYCTGVGAIPRRSLCEGECVEGATWRGEDRELSISVAGIERKAIAHLPPDSNRKETMPLVLNIHAMACDPEIQSWLSGFDPISDREGFVLLYPQGYGTADITDDPFEFNLVDDGFTFNAGGCCPAACRDKVDDVGFIRSLVEFVTEVWAPSQGFAIDPNRIFATGMSNGGFMTYRLGCEMSDIVAAIAPVAAVMTEMNEQTNWEDDPYMCNPENAPIPVLHIHDVADRAVPWDGGGIAGNFPSVEESIMRWREINGIDQEEAQTSFRSLYTCQYIPVVGETYYGADCMSWGSGRSNVTLCAMQCSTENRYFGHSWPGGPYGNGSLQASEQIWEFFKNHPKE